MVQIIPMAPVCKGREREREGEGEGEQFSRLKFPAHGDFVVCLELVTSSLLHRIGA